MHTSSPCPLGKTALALGLAATLSWAEGPPHEKGPFRKADLVEIATLDPAIHLDIRYATPNNFTGRAVYTEARAFLQRPAADALLRAAAALKPKGYGLLIFDGYRPWSVTKLFWDIVPPEKHWFVANPAKGSKHNRGCAVDLTLYSLETGREIEMPSAYDEISERAHPRYRGGSLQTRARATCCAPQWRRRASAWTPRSGGTSTIGTGSSTGSSTSPSTRSRSRAPCPDSLAVC